MSNKKFPKFLLVVVCTILVGCATSKQGNQSVEKLKQIEATIKPQIVTFRFVELDAKVSSINIPVKDKLLETGPISVTLAKPFEIGSIPFSIMNLTTRKIYISWPVIITFPLLKSLGIERLPLTFVGTAFVDQEAGDIFAVDVATVKIPSLGDIVMANVNNNKKKFPPSMDPYVRIDGKLTNLRPDEIKQYPLKNMIIEAFELANIDVSKNVIQGFLDQYSKNPTTELVFYFPETGKFESAELEGTDTLEFIKNPMAITF